MKTPKIALAIILLSSSVCMASSKKLISLESEIKLMTKLIESGKYQEFFNTYVKPDEIKKIEPSKYEQFIEKWKSSGKDKELLKSLKSILEDDYRKLEMAPNEIVQYSFKRDSQMNSIAFLLIENKWFIKN